MVEQECRLLQKRGHQVHVYQRSNEETRGLRGGIQFPIEAVWSAKTLREVRNLVAEYRPDVAHVHNTWAVVSPSVFHAFDGLPVVQTLHNYRWMCVNAQFRRDGVACEKCKELDFPVWGIVHQCYRGSRAVSGVLAAANYVARRSSSLDRVDLFVALTDFARQKFIEGGFSPDRIVCKPNFLAEIPDDVEGQGDYVVYAGRLASEKGVEVLLQAWRELDDVPLKVIGDGPLREEVEEAAGASRVIDYRGWQAREQVFEFLRGAAFVVLPSVCYEGFPMGVVEAYAHGRPVVGSDIGGIGEVVDHGETGLLVPADEPAALGNAVRSLWKDLARVERMGRNARRVFLEQYAPEVAYDRLMEVYEQARTNAARRI